MVATWTLVVAAALAFISTNVDDLFVLLVLYGQGRRLGSVLLGQYLGFSAIVGVSLAAAAGALLLRPEWVGFLGLAPVAIGTKMLVRARGGHRDPSGVASTTGGSLAVAAVTFANGGDNIAVYAPLFARRTWSGIATVLVVFAVMVAVWCVVAQRLARLPGVSSVLNRWGHRVAPPVLIALGVYIFFSEGAARYVLGMLGR
jgi:cadmium resistance protein CadD (predicted permease)